MDFGWGGVLARIREGGSIEFEQQQVGNGRWLYTHLVEHLSVREMLVHITQENVEMTVKDVQLLPAPQTLQEAVRGLLALPVVTH